MSPGPHVSGAPVFQAHSSHFASVRYVPTTQGHMGSFHCPEILLRDTYFILLSPGCWSWFYLDFPLPASLPALAQRLRYQGFGRQLLLTASLCDWL